MYATISPSMRSFCIRILLALTIEFYFGYALGFAVHHKYVSVGGEQRQTAVQPLSIIQREIRKSAMIFPSTAREGSISMSFSGQSRQQDIFVDKRKYDSLQPSTFQSRARGEVGHQMKSVTVGCSAVAASLFLPAGSCSAALAAQDITTTTVSPPVTIATNTGDSFPLKSDEIKIEIRGESIGLGLKDAEYKGRSRVLVNSIKENAEQGTRESVRRGMILVGVNDKHVEGCSLENVSSVIKSARKPISLVFRDPQKFFTLLRAPPSDTGAEVVGGRKKDILTTTLVPFTPEEAEQVLTVERYACNGPRKSPGAVVKNGDVVEILYDLKLPDGTILDTSVGSGRTVLSSDTDWCAPGKLAGTYDASVFFILGERKGKYTCFPALVSSSNSGAPPPIPGNIGGNGNGSGAGTSAAAGSTASALMVLSPGWDMLLTGMRVGEVRSLILPPCIYSRSLAVWDFLTYDSTSGSSNSNSDKSGNEKTTTSLASKIPDAKTNLVLTVALLSINGEANE